MSQAETYLGPEARARRRVAVVVVMLTLLAGACGTGGRAKPAGLPVETKPAAAVLPVVTLQENLVELGLYSGPIDGSFSPAVEASLRAFQGPAGAPATGALDSATSPALAAKLGAEDERPIATLQAALTDLGLYTGEFSSVYDKPTADAIGALQRKAGIVPPTGAFGARTAAALVKIYDEANIGDEPLERPPAPAPTSTTAFGIAPAPVLERGSRGPEVQSLQRRLADLGYRSGEQDGAFGEATASALLAFQKREGLKRTVQVDAATRARLAAPTGAGPRAGGTVPRIEVDIARQIMFVVSADGTTTLNTSTGNNEKYKEPRGGTAVAYTPTGTFSIGRRVDGVETAPLGKLYRPMYFHQGWAIHGSPSVPAYAASHGCARLSNADQDWLYGRTVTGAQVVLYDTTGKSPKVEPTNAAAGY